MATKCLSLLLATVALTVVLTLQAEADEQKTVNATVTALLISINVSPTLVEYGTQVVGATNVAPSPAFFGVTNTGNVNEKFMIKGADTANWALAGGAGTDAYVHRYSTSGSPGSFVALTTTNQTMFSSVVPTGGIDVYLNMDLPTVTTAGGSQTAAVTVIATQAP